MEQMEDVLTMLPFIKMPTALSNLLVQSGYHLVEESASFRSNLDD